MSVAKPFVFALVCAALGPEQARKKIGVNATGLPFSSLAAVERGRDGVTNAMVNPGAIAATSLLPGGSAEARWQFLVRGLSAFAGRDLALDEEDVRERGEHEPPQPGDRQPAAELRPGVLRPGGGARPVHQAELPGSPAEDLAVMGATLADGGLNPLTGEQWSARTPAGARWP